MSVFESTTAPKPLSEIKKEIEGLDVEQQLADACQDERLNDVYPFDFSYTDKRGNVFRGRFVNRILNIEEQLKVGFTQALLTGRVPIASLPVDAAETARRVAHLMISLNETKPMPEWAKDLGKIKDVSLIDALYQEVDTHEAIFRGDQTA